jgi:spermidine synthase
LKDRSRLLLLLFFVSGGCGLIYEVVWTRLFVVVIGNTVFSVSAILSVFMAGLALGSRLAGRLVDEREIPLVRWYAALEAGIALYNLALPLLLKAANPIFGAAYNAAHDSFWFLTFVRLAVASILLIVPATLMGATLPILIRFYTENIANVGEETGKVYTANTWGAAVGTAAAGFLLVPYLGVTVTLFVAVAINLVIAATAWGLSGSAPVLSRPATARTEVPGPRIVLIAMSLSGFAALADEVAWTRVLGLVVGPTTYAFTLMLTSMIAGLGIGAALGTRIAKRSATISTFAWVEIAIGLTSLAIVPAFGRMPVWVGQIVTKYVEQFGMIQGIEFLIFFALMLVPTTFLGMTFPIASRLYAKSDSLLGSEVSAVYAFNTIGGILGSLAAGFFLIPHVGSQWALIIAAALNAVAGVFLAPPPLRWTPSLAALAAIPGILLIPRWNPELMSSGAYKYAPYYNPRSDLESMLTSGDLVYFKEGATTTVSVRKQHGDTTLAVDGKVDATDSGDMTTQKMLGHLPLLLSDRVQRVAIIGLGSGVTAGAVLQYPVQSLDVVEISPEVAEASDFFRHVNHDALKDSRTHLIIGDGRNHLRYIGTTYDVIISEPSNPWMSGMASLFSREFFQEALARLTAKGILCQWVHSYNMETSDLRSIIATFRSVFPHSQLWALNQNDFLLLGSPAPIEISAPVLTRNFAQAQKDLESFGLVDMYSLTSLYMLEDADLDTFATGGALNTDSNPVLEFHAPRFIYANTSDQNYAALTSIKKKVAVPLFAAATDAAATAEQHRHKAQMYLKSESFLEAVAEFKSALSANPDDSESWNGILRAARSLHVRPEVKPFVEQLLQNHPSTPVRLAAAEFYSQENNSEKAIALIRSALEQEPRNVQALEKLADIQMENGSTDLPATVDSLLAVDPDNADGLYQLASIRFYQQRLDEAIQLVKRSLARDSTNPRARNLLAIAYGQTFQADLADAEFRKCVQDFPSDWLTLNNYGLFLLERSRPADAAAAFKKAIDLNPENAQGFVGLGEATRQEGHASEANRWYRIALQLDPSQAVAKQYVH